MFTVKVDQLVEEFTTLLDALARAAYYAQKTNAVQALVCCMETGEVMSVSLLFR